jgi:ribonuclease HII
MTFVCGIEEAGRGPVIGPLVMAAVVINEKNESQLKQAGVKDSKKCTHTQRKKLSELIRKVAHKFRVLIIPPEEVDAAVLSSSINLNWLEAMKSAQFINELKPDTAILDCPSPNIRAYKEYVMNKLEGDAKKTTIIAEHKADVNHIVVAAASIIAKVVRDEEIEKIKAEVGINFGSGYAADPLTKVFVENHFEQHSHIMRKSWSSYTRQKAKKDQKSLADF